MTQVNTRNSLIHRARIRNIFSFNGEDVLRDPLQGQYTTGSVLSDSNLHWRKYERERCIYCDTNSFQNNYEIEPTLSDGLHTGGTGGFTVRFRVDAIGTTQGIVRLGPLSLRLETDGTLNFRIGSGTNVCSTTVVANRWYTVTCYHTGTGGNDQFYMWADGELVDSDIDLNNQENNTSQSHNLFRDAPGAGMVGAISFYATHHGTSIEYNKLNDGAIRELHQNPWQLFKAQPIIGAHQLPTHVDYGMVKVPWTKQPPPGTPLDLDNPLTRSLDLVDAMDDPKGQDVSGNYPRNFENDVIPRVSRQPGRGQYWDISAGVDSVRRGYSVGNDFSGIPEITVASLHRIVSAQTLAHFFAKKDRSGFLSWELYKTGTGGNANKYWLFVNTSGGTYGNDAGAVLADDYDPHLVVGVFKTDSHLQVWLDGALYASDADTPTGNITTRSWAVTFAGEDDGAGGINQSPQDEEIFLNCVWSRALSEAEIKAFSANPWQIFKPREIMVPINEDLPELVKFEVDW